MSKITLAGQDFEVVDLPFGTIKKIIASLNRFQAQGSDDETSINEVSPMLGLLIGKSAEEIDAMSIKFYEMNEAIAAIPDICGLVKRSAALGEV